MFSIFASPSVRRPLTSAAIWATSGSLLASAIGITAMVVGPARKDQAGAQHPHGDRRAQDGEPRDRSEGAMRRRLKSKKRFAGSLFVATAAVVSGAAGSGWLTGAISGAAGTATSVTPASVTWARHLGLEQIAASRNDPDHLALVVAKRGADFADALEQAVLADMDVRPDRFHQLLLAQDAAGIPGEQPQYLQGLGPELDRLAIGRGAARRAPNRAQNQKSAARPLPPATVPI